MDKSILGDNTVVFEDDNFAEHPEQLSQCAADTKALHFLDCTGFTDEVAAKIASLTKLETLGISFLEEIGEPNIDAVLRVIHKLGNLQKLELIGCTATGNFPNFGKLANLTTLSLNSSIFKAVGNSLSTLEKLDYLDLYCNEHDRAGQPDYASLLGSIPNLRTLVLPVFMTTACSLSALVKKIPGLTYLNYHNDCDLFTDANISPAEIAASHLESLAIHSDEQGACIPEWICSLPRVTKLYIGGLAVRKLPTNISAMQQLEKLDLSCTLLDGALPENLSQLPKLKEIHMGGYPTPEGVPQGVTVTHDKK